MKCEDAVDVLTSRASEPGARHGAAQHARACPACADALRALDVLRAERGRRVPLPEGGIERALAAALRPTPVPARRASFWLGALVGAAAAAAAVVAAVVLVRPGAPPPGSAPEILLTLNEPRDVSIALDSPVALEGATISVTLNGGIELRGFAGQRRVEWSADLASGVNELKLPIVVRDTAGGQLAVEVQHREKRRVLVVDVRSGRRGTRPAGV